MVGAHPTGAQQGAAAAVAAIIAHNRAHGGATYEARAGESPRPHFRGPSHHNAPGSSIVARPPATPTHGPSAGSHGTSLCPPATPQLQLQLQPLQLRGSPGTATHRQRQEGPRPRPTSARMGLVRGPCLHRGPFGLSYTSSSMTRHPCTRLCASEAAAGSNDRRGALTGCLRVLTVCACGVCVCEVTACTAQPAAGQVSTPRRPAQHSRRVSSLQRAAPPRPPVMVTDAPGRWCWCHTRCVSGRPLCSCCGPTR